MDNDQVDPEISEMAFRIVALQFLQKIVIYVLISPPLQYVANPESPLDLLLRLIATMAPKQMELQEH